MFAALHTVVPVTPAIALTHLPQPRSPETPGGPERVSWAKQAVVGGAVILPFLGLVAAIVLLWGWGWFSWLDLGLMVGLYALSGLGVTVGYHRLFTHRSFQAGAVVKATLAILGSMAVEGPVVKWVAAHRSHHQHSDKPGDPHSPHQHGSGFWATLGGLWHAHTGWLFEPDEPNLAHYVPDLLADRPVRRISSLFVLWVALGLLIPAIIGGLVTGTWLGALLGLIWGGLVRIFVLHHVTWSTNSVCHIWGTHPYRSHDESRNNPIFGLLGMGEGWHNNHHAFPTSARHGLRWWQLDASYLVIRLLALVHLARDLHVPDADTMKSKRRVRGEDRAEPIAPSSAAPVAG
jgi:stearoyl-CoA desaturase (delta-9 desaturase)